LGGGGADLLRGGPGRDQLFGEEGRDTFEAGPGPDAVHANEAADDQDQLIECGFGTDKVVLDSVDPKPHDCEDQSTR
jgi:Ca2+-binding RTX toxin-like protein